MNAIKAVGPVGDELSKRRVESGIVPRSPTPLRTMVAPVTDQIAHDMIEIHLESLRDTPRIKSLPPTATKIRSGSKSMAAPTCSR